MGDCGQGCPPTKVPRGLGTRCSLEAMGREVGEQASYGHRFRRGGFHSWSAGILARIVFARPSSRTCLERGFRVRGLASSLFGVARPREWQAMGACGQGYPGTKVPRGLGTRCSLEAMGREVGEQASYGHRFRRGGFHPSSAGIPARIFFARPSSLTCLETGSEMGAHAGCLFRVA